MKRIWLFVFILLFPLTVFPQSPSVTLTFDDLPAAGTSDATEIRAINLAILSSLDRHHAPATAFIIGRRAHLTNQSWPMLEEWKRRGYSLGNHTWSHPNFADLTIAQEEDDILKGERAIAPCLLQASNFSASPTTKQETPLKSTPPSSVSSKTITIKSLPALSTTKTISSRRFTTRCLLFTIKHPPYSFVRPTWITQRLKSTITLSFISSYLAMKFHTSCCSTPPGSTLTPSIRF
jgi:Polysaccharide deacetylase